MARYTMIIDQMQGHQQCTGYNAYREHPGRDHCQHERHTNHGGAKAGTDLAAHRSANELDDADDQNQCCNTIELGVAIRQHHEQHENTAQQWAD